MITVTRLQSLALQMPEPEMQAARSFYAKTWGLKQCDEEKDEAVFFRGSGPDSYILQLQVGNSRRVRRIAFNVASAVVVDEAEHVLRQLGLKVTQTPTALSSPGGGYGLHFIDPSGFEIELCAEAAQVAPLADEAILVERLSHIVLNVTDVARAREFYTGVLDFQISDWYANDAMVFLRCSSQHHCFVITPGQWASLNHVAFEVGTVDKVMQGYGRMRAGGYETLIGPGRHGPGGNVFCYFQDPGGFVIEHTAELYEVPDEWTPHEWDRTPLNLDTWGLNRMTPEVARAMAGEPQNSQE